MLKGSNRKRSKYNLFFGVTSQLVTIIFGILVPRLVLVSYGSELNGLINSITQIFAYFTLFEAGIGAAALQALYKTVSSNDHDGTNGILAATNKYYKKTGLLYLIAIAILAIIYPMVVQSTISPLVIVWLVLLNGVSPVINFLFQGKYKLLLQAEGKIYITTNISTIINVLTSIAKIILLTNNFDVLAVQFIVMIINLVQMVYISLYIKRHYQWIDLKVAPNTSAISQSKNALIHQVSGLIFFNTDTVLLTFFAGLKAVSVYSMFTLLLNMVKTLISTISNSIVFMLGQTFNLDKKKFIKMHNAYETYYLAIIFALYSTALFFLIPFMKLYTVGIKDADYTSSTLAILFVSANLFSNLRVPVTQVIEFAGHFKQTQWRALFEAGINLSVSIICVINFGIYGVLFGTIAALIYRSNDAIIYTHKYILKTSCMQTYKKCIAYILTFIGLQFVNSVINIDLSSYFRIFVWVVPYSLVMILLYVSIGSIVDLESFQYIYNYFNKSSSSRNTRVKHNVLDEENDTSKIIKVGK